MSFRRSKTGCLNHIRWVKNSGLKRTLWPSYTGLKG